MKKKLVSVLLVLTLCGSLAIPTFAEPVEELPVQKETPPFGVAASAESEVFEVSFWVWSVSSEDNAVNAKGSDHTHYFEYGKETRTWYEKNSNQHQKWAEYKAHCIYGCGAYSTISEPVGGWESHSWSKGSLVGYQSSSAVAHKAVYNYSCKCGATKTESEATPEPHSLKEVGYTGNNYHQSTKHYFEYQYQCSQCGYTKTQYKSYSCPGPQGGGCILPDTPINRVEPPVEVQDVTETEEIQSGEGTDLKEVTAPEETTAPEEAGLPEETVLPEEVIEPEESILPEETT